MKRIFDRFRNPIRSVDEEKILDAAHSIFRTPSGEMVLEHLIEHFGLDDPAGSLSVEEANYRHACHDVIKYILALANEINTRSN